MYPTQFLFPYSHEANVTVGVAATGRGQINPLGGPLQGTIDRECSLLKKGVFGFFLFLSFKITFENCSLTGTFASSSLGAVTSDP